MKRKEIEAEFIQFLKDNDCLIEFICNLVLFENQSLTKYFTSIFIGVDQTDILIGSAFQWIKTSEGYPYWSQLDRKWSGKCNTEEIKLTSV